MKKLLVVLLVLGMAVPAMAADWNFYGSARMATWRVSDDPGGTAKSSDNTQWNLQGNSRIGAKVKTSDVIGGRFEYGTGVNVRLLYGTWNFGSGQLLVGQSYTPTNAFYSNSVYGTDGNLLGVGGLYEGRKPMLQLKMGAFKVALVQPTQKSTISATGKYEVDLPKIEAAYSFKADTFFVDVFGGYQTYDAINATASGKDESVASYVVGVGGGVNMDAFYAKAALHYGINLGDYGALVLGKLTQDKYADYDADGDYDDSKGLGYLAVLGFKASDKFTVEAGYSAMTYEPDVSGSKEDKAQQYYINATINIAPGFFVVPEFGIIDRDSDLVDQGDVTYFGAKWQINF